MGALTGLVVHDLGIEELIGYRTSIEGVSNADVTAAARAHVLLDSAAIVVVGDADQFGEALEAAGIGPVVVERDEGPVASGPLPEEEVAPVDEEDETGPTAGAEEPDLPGSADEPALADGEGRR